MSGREADMDGAGCLRTRAKELNRLEILGRVPGRRLTLAQVARQLGLIEWTCIQADVPHIDGPKEQTVGTRFDLSRAGPALPGCPVNVEVELIKLEKRRPKFRVSARGDVVS